MHGRCPNLIEISLAIKEFLLEQAVATKKPTITKELGITVTIKEPSITIANLTNLLLKLVS